MKLQEQLKLDENGFSLYRLKMHGKTRKQPELIQQQLLCLKVEQQSWLTTNFQKPNHALAN
jgi:hypothetical protein